MHRWLPTLLLALVLASPAEAAEPPRAGGAGLYLNEGFAGHAPEGFGGGELTAAPGVLTCPGGAGHVVLKHTRVGGEGSYCFAPGTEMVQLGAQIGGHLPVGETYVAAYAGLGYGRLQMEAEAAYDAHFAYVRPALAIGLPLGIVAVEIGGYGVFPFPFAQTVDGERVQGGTFPHAGVLVSILLGHHPRQRDAADAVVDAEEPSPREAAAVETPPGAPEESPAAPPPSPADRSP